MEELRAGVAQLAEQLICNQQVAGSSPIASSIDELARQQGNVGRFPSGQREQTVNLPRNASVVRIHPCPPFAGMAELADALDSGSSDHYDSCRFKSCFPHQSPENAEFSGLFTVLVHP